ncbi:MAG: metal ABC transporter substrate-binding protein [candidate division WOR-3 bacterium]
MSRRRSEVYATSLALGLLSILLGCRRMPRSSTEIRVVTTLGVLADWARQIGGERIQVVSLLTGRESPHTYEPRPSDVRRIADAHVLFRVGLGLEEWLEPLITNANNPDLVIITAADSVSIIEGEPHSRFSEPTHHSEIGNPHIWLDPENAKIAINHLVAALIRIDPKGESLYRSNQVRYTQRLDSLSAAIKTEFAALSDHRLVTFHDAWPYFARRFGLEIVACLEPIPGKEPSARQVAQVIGLVRKQGVRVIGTEPQLPSDVPTTIAQATGAKLVVTNPLCIDETGQADYTAMLGQNARLIADALR